MARTLSMLKPNVKTMILDNEIKEKVTYLDVAEQLTLTSLRSDVKKGAVQFRELDKLVEKENESKYILITTDDKEFGYMAVAYLTAAFNQKNRMYGKEELSDDSVEEWEEDAWRVPIITENELRHHISSENESFSNGPFYTMGNQRAFMTNPYWMDCRSKAVCIFTDDHSGYGFGFGGQNTDALYDGLEFFRNNEKVYIINLISKAHFGAYWDEDLEDFQEEEEENYSCNYNRGKWNHIILSFAADEVEVLLPKKEEKRYYKEVLRGIFHEKGIKAVKGFSYETVLHLFLGMQEEAKCQLLENIVNYAIKDWLNNHPKIIKVSDFAFMDRFVRTKSMLQGAATKEKKDISAKEQLEQHLIGMEQVKEQVHNVINVMKFNRMRAQMHIHGGSYHNVHVMLGAPGTAKTTVAQLMGQMMVEEHLLPDNRFTCVNGAELKGMYVGHSAPKTKALFEENDIIVIDEAYSLVSDSGENDSFSKEAIAQLIIELENHSMDKLVIFAGYGGEKVSEKNNKMKAFLDANPGIKSRITSTIYFDSYSPKEMIDIFFQIAKNQNYVVEENVKELLQKHFEKRVDADNFGNGREARSLLETTVIFAAKRLFGENKSKYKKSDMQNLIYEDVRQAIVYTEKADSVQRGVESKRIGF